MTKMIKLCKNLEFLLHVSLLVVMSVFFYFMIDILSALNFTSTNLMLTIMVLASDSRYVGPFVFLVSFPISIIVILCVTILLLLSMDRLVDFQIEILSKSISLRSLIIDKFILFLILALRIWYGKLKNPNLNIFLYRKENET